MKFILIIWLHGLAYTLGRVPRTEYQTQISSCVNNTRACPVSCKLKASGTSLCHLESGYCLCPASVKHSKICREPNGAEEMQKCNTFTCGDMSIDSHPSANTRRLSSTNRAQSQARTIQLMQEISNERKIPKALVCFNEEDGTLHCACFQTKQKARQVKIIREKIEHAKIINNKFGNGR